MSTVADILALANKSYRIDRDGSNFQWGCQSLHTNPIQTAQDVWRVFDDQLEMFLNIVSGFPQETITLSPGPPPITISSFIPLRFQWSTNVVANSFGVKGLGPPLGKNQRYKHYEVTINYSTPQYALTGANALQSVQINPDNKSVPTPFGYPWPVIGFNYAITKHNLSTFDISFYQANQSTVNASPWRGAPRGCALFISPYANESFMADQSTRYNVTLPFNISEIEHNYEINEEGIAYVPTIIVGGVTRPKHRYVEFNDVFGV